MVYAKYIKKHYGNNNEVVGYTLQDTNGTVMTVTAQQLKEAIASGLIEITNLELTPNGRLIDKVRKQDNVAQANNTTITVRYLEKHYDVNKNIIGYTLQDTNGTIMKVTTQQVKEAIANRLITVLNLTLTSDGRLIDNIKAQGPSMCVGLVYGPDNIINGFQIKTSTGNISTISTDGIRKRLLQNPKCISNVALGLDGTPYIKGF